MHQRIIATAITAILASQVTHSQTSNPRLSSAIDYETGSSSSINRVPTTSDSYSSSLSIGTSWKANMQCGTFDPQISISNQLNGITDGFKNYMGSIINNATGAVASLPALIIQRANPGLYDLLQQGVMQGKLDFESAEMSCEGFQNVLMGDPASLPWNKGSAAAKDRVWQEEIAASGGDAVAAKDSVRDVDPGNEGVVWVCGDKAGGSGQPTIKSTADVIVAGYNMLHDNSDVCEIGAPSPSMQTDSVLFQYWETAQAAAAYAIAAIGEVEVATCDGCDKIESTHGKGLEYQLRDLSAELYDLMYELIDTDLELTRANLDLVSAPPNIRMTAPVIYELRKMNPIRRSELVQRLSDEIAFGRTIEQSRLLVRMFRAGQREPNVKAYADAEPHIDKSVAVLQENIETILVEMASNNRVANKTMKQILVFREKDIQSTSGVGTRTNAVKADLFNLPQD